MYKIRWKSYICFILVVASLGSASSLPIENGEFSKKKLSNSYSPYFLRLLQIAMGSDEIISQGGYDSVDIMFNGIDLNGKKALDIGCGFGGVAIYLAEKFDTEITAVEREPYMLKCAQHYLEQHREFLIGNVRFQTLNEPTTLSEFEENAFDLVYSKEVFYHVPYDQKQQYMDEAFRVLKPGGMVIFADWFQSSPDQGERLKLATTVKEVCQYSTPQSFREIMERSHFQNISYADQTSEHIKYTEADIQRLHQSAETIRQDLGESACNDALAKVKLWLEAQVYGELLSGIFIAQKPLLH